VKRRSLYERHKSKSRDDKRAELQRLSIAVVAIAHAAREHGSCIAAAAALFESIPSRQQSAAFD